MDNRERVELLDQFYSDIYRNSKHDSPEQSRINAARMLIDILKVGIPGENILNIGSGPQSFEKQLFMPRRGAQEQFLNQFSFYSVDIADMKGSRLMAKNYGVQHSRANALKLPFPNKYFGLILGCFSLDFLPSEAYLEAERVLMPHGKAIFLFHHPELIPDDLRPIRDERKAKFWTFLKEENILFKDAEQIEDFLNHFHMQPDEIKLANDRRDKWWEVEATKINGLH